MEGLRDAIDVCGLADLSFEGRKWTYEKKATVRSFCQVRLDRELATADWTMRYPLARVWNHSIATLDHGLIALT
jgi:hypothetical protein